MNGTERKGIQVRYFFIALARYCINRFMHEEFGWTNYCINRMFGRKTAGSLILSGNDAIFANANAPKKVQNFPLVRPDWRRNAGFFLSCAFEVWVWLRIHRLQHFSTIVLLSWTIVDVYFLIIIYTPARVPAFLSDRSKIVLDVCCSVWLADGRPNLLLM